jgi:hypothetical protein
MTTTSQGGIGAAAIAAARSRRRLAQNGDETRVERARVQAAQPAADRDSAGRPLARPRHAAGPVRRAGPAWGPGGAGRGRGLGQPGMGPGQGRGRGGFGPGQGLGRGMGPGPGMGRGLMLGARLDLTDEQRTKSRRYSSAAR